MHSKLAGRRLARLAAATLVATLAACGGGGDDDGGSVVRVSEATTLAPTAVTTVDTATTRWMPSLNDTWQLQLQGTINTSYNVAVYDIDLFDTPQATINALKAQGKRVVCYFSAGSSENWRPDYSKFKPSDMGNALDGWAGERWLDTRSANVRAIMQARMDLAKSKGCDGVDADNVDGYTNNPGLPLTAATQLNYNRFLADQAHARGLAIGLKNAVAQLADLASSFDFAVNEQCFQYNECSGYSAFTVQGKPVFNVEYQAKWKDATTRQKLCAKARALNLRSLVLPLALNDKFRYSCD
ncbi:endo alpha-1,4 polygalactosaminidase [Cupriavidus pauculus]|uniref:Endo alpha-1,4 polygalactosaminidase n=1 Tax=Cupriavidus pauculus TaxID=82633 RepID=A0A3G8GYD9_9BURK|nr:endo alpha-1,4 polygalactosaminidase [Cupriavidus pauculus]AZG13251.1 endo alpha-1,4 polygalactosaminidase [Cupriavidus pauculus]